MLFIEFVSVFACKTSLLNGCRLNSCIYSYIVVICLIIETLGSQHTSRLWLHVPMVKASLAID
jgi:hypothetical protein